MKKTALLMTAALLSLHAAAQKLEVALQASGNSTKYNSHFSSGIYEDNYYTDSYGYYARKSVSFDVKAQVVFKPGFLIGMQAGYEVLKSQSNYYPVLINAAVAVATSPALTYDPRYVPVDNRSYVVNKFINLNPYIGYRIPVWKCSVDVMPGVDLGFRLSSTERLVTKYQSSDYYSVSYTPQTAKLDVRLRGGLAVNYNRWSVTGSYSHGLTKFLPSSSTESRSRVARLGIAYRIF